MGLLVEEWSNPGFGLFLNVLNNFIKHINFSATSKNMVWTTHLWSDSFILVLWHNFLQTEYIWFSLKQNKKKVCCCIFLLGNEPFLFSVFSLGSSRPKHCHGPVVQHCECAGTIYVCVFVLASACEVSLTSARAIRSVAFHSSVSFYFVLDSFLHLCSLARTLWHCIENGSFLGLKH